MRCFPMKHIKFIVVVVFALTLSFFIASHPDNSKVSAIVHKLDLSGYPKTGPDVRMNLLFIHHSVGATLLANKGGKSGKYCLWKSHPNGGGLRNLLTQNNYNVHEATYSSKVGQKTDIHDWHSKFRDHMDVILRTKIQDDLIENNGHNQIVVFKSCYPNSIINSVGSPPGDPDSPEKTLWNYKAAYNSLLPIFEKHPETLFVAVTAPPEVKPRMNQYKEFLFGLLGFGPEEMGKRNRKFNNWLVDMHSGWLSNYKQHNVVVFDYYNILTGNGASNWNVYGSSNGRNSHPNSEGNKIAAGKFVDFINRAIRYSGLYKDE